MKDIQQSFQLKETVSLCNAGITDHQFEIICEKYTGKVRKLDLQRNFVTAAGIALMKNPKWANLRELHLWKNIIGDHGCKFLSQVAIPHLIWLNLIDNLLGSTGVSHLSKGRWPRLQELFLSKNVMIQLKTEWVLEEQVVCRAQTSKNFADQRWVRLSIPRLQLFDGEREPFLADVRERRTSSHLHESFLGDTGGNTIGWLSKLKLENLLCKKFKDPVLII